MNQGVMPEGLGLNPELPLQQIDFIPIAGSSTDEPEMEQNIWEENPKNELVDDIVQAKLKRKADECTNTNSDTPTCPPDLKKARRINKRGKRVKS